MGVMSRIIGVIGAGALIAGTAIGLAAPASAVPNNVSITCVGSSLVLSSNNIATNDADTLVVTNNTGAGLVRTTIANATGPFTLAAGGGTQTGTFTVVGSTGGLVRFTQDPMGGCANATVTLNFTGGGGGGGGGGGSSSSSAPAAPADVVQQVGVPADGKCSSIVDATLNWAGVSSGGWGTSWAQWMNGGKGGAVCNRALFYDLRLSKWGVRA